MDSLERPLFGDVLALARERWVREMARRLAARGYREYRRSDAFALRFLSTGPRALGEFAAPFGATRQAARKMVTGLIQRGYASLEVDPRDARRRRVLLTTAGREYAKAVIHTIDALNREVASIVDPADLATARSVLTLVKDGFAP
jgi:DNA-binding MarR family transcriptional regulator